MNDIRVGLVGAGPWATSMHAPMWAGGQGTVLSGVWARRHDAAAELGKAHDVPAAATFDELVAESDVLAFAVPPEVQWRLAVRAAQAGRHLVLEKPIADTLDHARTLADAVAENGVASLVMFTARYDPGIQGFLDRANEFDAIGARAAMLTGAFIDGPFADSPWRHISGALYDIGPHVFDLVTAALGPATAINAHISARGWVTGHLEHANGSVSDVALTCHIDKSANSFTIELYGPAGALTADLPKLADPDRLPDRIRESLLSTLKGGRTACDIESGLRAQELIDAAERSLRVGTTVAVGDTVHG